MQPLFTYLKMSESYKSSSEEENDHLPTNNEKRMSPMHGSQAKQAKQLGQS